MCDQHDVYCKPISSQFPFHYRAQAREQATAAAAEVREVRELKRDAERAKRQNRDLAVAFSNARTKIEALQVELNALRSEKALLIRQAAERREEAARQRGAAEAAPAEASASAAIEASRRALSAKEASMDQLVKNLRAEVRALTASSQSAQGKLQDQKDAVRRLQRQLADQQRRAGFLQLAASLASGALVALFTAWAAASFAAQGGESL